MRYRPDWVLSDWLGRPITPESHGPFFFSMNTSYEGKFTMPKPWYLQLRDQVLGHIPIGLLAGFLLVYRPWSAPLGVALWFAIGFREGKQFPSARSSINAFWRRLGGYDPYLDTANYTLGTVLGVLLTLRFLAPL